MKECALKGNLIAVNIRLYAMKIKNKVNIQDCENRREKFSSALAQLRMSK